MAFDGITIANIVKELNDTILNGRIAKIAQPENDELLLTIKPAKGQVRLVISASASLPLIYLSRDNKPSPMTAPNFCMLEKTYCKWPHRRHFSAFPGTDHPLRDRAPG